MKLSEILPDIGRPVAYYPQIARAVGSVNAALFLCQMIYWMGKQKSAEGWIYKAQAEIFDETGLSIDEQQTARKRLVKLGVLEEKLKGIPATMNYRVNTAVLDDLWTNYVAYNAALELHEAKTGKRKTSVGGFVYQPTSKRRIGESPKLVADEGPDLHRETTQPITESTIDNTLITAENTCAQKNKNPVFEVMEYPPQHTVTIQDKSDKEYVEDVPIDGDYRILEADDDYNNPGEDKLNQVEIISVGTVGTAPPYNSVTATKNLQGDRASLASGKAAAMPSDYSVSPALKRWAEIEARKASVSISIELAATKFEKYYKTGNGQNKKSKNWDGTFEQWVLTDLQKSKETNNGKPSNRKESTHEHNTRVLNDILAGTGYYSNTEPDYQVDYYQEMPLLLAANTGGSDPGRYNPSMG